MAKFRKGQKAVMSKEALDNYGYEYEGIVLVITHVATKYMPAKEFYAKGMPDGYHPGYDEVASGIGLYDVDGFNGSLYDWELEQSK